MHASNQTNELSESRPTPHHGKYDRDTSHMSSKKQSKNRPIDIAKLAPAPAPGAYLTPIQPLSNCAHCGACIPFDTYSINDSQQRERPKHILSECCAALVCNACEDRYQTTPIPQKCEVCLGVHPARMSSKEGNESLQRLAVQQHPDALFALAIRYRDGQRGLRADGKLCGRLLELAVLALGHADSCIRLADMLLGVGGTLSARPVTTGVPHDDARGLRLMMHAAAGGHPYAQFVMGDILSRGMHGTPEDKASAVSWWTLAANVGCKEAQSKLGVARLQHPPAQARPRAPGSQRHLRLLGRLHATRAHRPRRRPLRHGQRRRHRHHRQLCRRQPLESSAIRVLVVQAT